MSLQNDRPDLLPDEPERRDQIQPSREFPVVICGNESERIASAQRIIEAISNDFNGLETYVILKNAEGIIKTAIEVQKEAALSRLNTKEDTILGVKVAQRKSVEYEYNHPRLDEIERQMKELDEEKKNLKKLLQSMTEPMAYGTTGEMIEPAKKIKDGLTIVVTLPK